MKVEVAVVGSPFLIALMVSVDVKHHWNYIFYRGQELCESRGGRPGLPVPRSPYGLCGRKAAFEEDENNAETGCTRTQIPHNYMLTMSTGPTRRSRLPLQFPSTSLKERFC